MSGAFTLDRREDPVLEREDPVLEDERPIAGSSDRRANAYNQSEYRAVYNVCN